MLNNIGKYLALSLSLALLNACTAQDVKTATQVNGPTENSNNQTNQTNAGSGTQVNNSGSGSSNTNTGSGSQNVNSGTQSTNTNTGSGTQTSTTNTQTGSGTQTNTTVNNTNTGDGPLVQPVNTGSGNQTTTVVTGTQNNNTVAGNQTVVNGNQTNNTVTNNTTINNTFVTQIVQNVSVNLNSNTSLETQQQVINNYKAKWDPLPGATEYTVFLNNTPLAKTNTLTLDIPQNLITNPTQDKITISASNGQVETAQTADIFVIAKTTFSGVVVDDSGTSMSGVTVRAKSLNSSVFFESSTTTVSDGKFAFNNAPTGVLIEITVSKTGYTTRRRVEVLQSSGNIYDFSSVYAISDKPEVVTVTPGRNASGVDSKTSFVLKFSEPMDRSTVQDTFSLRSYNNRKLTVDQGSVQANTLMGLMNISDLTGTQIWDKSAFTISWNSDDTEATFTFKQEKMLPTDKDSSRVPDYQVAFKSFSGADRNIKDKSGITRTSNHFKLTDGAFEESYKFSIKTDEVRPTITGITAETAENGGFNGDAIRVRFNERMIHYTRDLTIAGGMENISGSAAKAPAAYPGSSFATVSTTACNYQVQVLRLGTEIFNSSWCNLPGGLVGGAVFDTDDSTHKTVLLLPPSGSDLYKPGDSVRVTVATTVMDPAGNTVDSSGNNVSANAS